ncbi:MAG TPA: hypothetical protein VM577_07430 [Anaerovoracaceae bacterium]|nr:hypothetical protein [Anaerovoracaceae bacterium]
MEEKKELICHKCQVPLIYAETKFNYLEHDFKANMLRCPKCGQIFIPEDIVKGRMAEVEMAFESK